jgi:hypothetical protein
MNAAAQALDNTIPDSPDFGHGRTFKHLNGEIVNFTDVSWCICPTRGSRLTVTFQGLPAWLIRPAKLTIAHGWLTQGRSHSWIACAATSFKRIAGLFADFQGASMAELGDEHFVIVQRRLDQELTTYNDTLEEAARSLGRPLSFRESKEISRASQLRGDKSIRTWVLMFNLAAALLEEIDGISVPRRLRIPRAMSQASAVRSIGSADPKKVLSSEQLAELERALGRDLHRYEKARALIRRELDGLDLSGARFSPVFELERYFGINGFREHKASEVAVLRGLSSSSDTNVPRRIKKFLAKRIGPSLAHKVMTLRSQFGHFRAKKRFEELNTARDYILSVLESADLSVLDPKAFCMERYFGLNGCRVHSLLTIGKQLGLKTERSAIHHIRDCLVSVVGERKAKRLLAVRQRLLYYFTRAIKAQALRLQIGVARRISAVLEVSVDPSMKVRVVEARRIVEIQFRADKTWGDEGLSEWVPCIDRFGEIAEDAIRVAQTLTTDLRELASSDARERLFIIPNSSFDVVVPLSSAVLHEYIYTSQPGKDNGLLRRYALEELASFSFQHIRHTHSTHMIKEGGTIQDVAHYLGHTTGVGFTTMAGTFYLAGGTEAMRQRTAEALRRGAATGLLFDGIARMKIEAMGNEAKAAPVPPNQLSFEQARQRILSGDLIEEMPIGPAEAVRLLQQKVVVNVTRQGGCLLPATSGPCPTANPCAIGILPRGKEPTPGCGCKYLVILPHSAEQLTAEIAIMDAQLAEMSTDEWTVWRSHIGTKRDHYRVLLEKAMALNESTKKTN